MIDFHAHIGNLTREGYPARPPLSPHQLVDRMNREGIAMAVLLPLESPEGGWGYCLTEEVVAARDLYPERFIPFVDADPRYPYVREQIDFAVTHYGCRGFGEHVNGLAFNDPLNRVIYEKCAEHGLPLVLDMNTDLCRDEPGLPGLEACLRDFPGCTFVGHGPAFWASISGDYDFTGATYPRGPITPGGAVDRLMDEYDNLWADLSAGSGYNALNRDPGFTPGFLDRHWQKLMFGTDIVWPGQALPIVQWMKTVHLAADRRAAIMSGNARRLLKLDD